MRRPLRLDLRSSSKGETQVRELTRAQQLIARRMASPVLTVPTFDLQADVDMSGALELRRSFREWTGGRLVPSLNDLVVKACALALRQFPIVNGSYVDGHVELYSRVNVGVAVAIEESLVVPVVVDADAKALSVIASDTRRLAERARTGELTPPELAEALSPSRISACSGSTASVR